MMCIIFLVVFKAFSAVAYMPILHGLVSQPPVFSFSFVDLMVWLFASGVAKLSEKVGTGE